MLQQLINVALTRQHSLFEIQTATMRKGETLEYVEILGDRH
jgi:hypothetical protein